MLTSIYDIISLNWMPSLDMTGYVRNLYCRLLESLERNVHQREQEHDRQGTPQALAALETIGGAEVEDGGTNGTNGTNGARVALQTEVRLLGELVGEGREATRLPVTPPRLLEPRPNFVHTHQSPMQTPGRQQESLMTPSLQPGLTPSLQPGFTPSLHPGLTPSLQPGLTPSVIRSPGADILPWEK